MKDYIAEQLQKQLNRERYNSQAYLFIGSICENMAFDGFASFFRKQAQDEIGHAHRFEEFLISKRVQPQYRDLEGFVGAGWLDLSLDRITNIALSLELATTAHLSEMYFDAEGEDPQVCALVYEMLLEQVEEEKWATDLVDLVSRSDYSGWLILDEKYGKL